jgi:hypothetical protein
MIYLAPDEDHYEDDPRWRRPSRGEQVNQLTVVG